MALMEVTYLCTFRGQELVNRWNYVSNGTPAAVTLSFALNFAFGGAENPALSAPLNRVLAAQSTEVQAISLAVRDVYSDFDFYEHPFPVPYVGLRGGESASPTMAWGFYTNRIRRDVRRGQKRIGGISETDMAGGGSINPASLAFVTNVATAMSETLSYTDEGNALTFVPCVVGKQEYTPDPLRPERKAYRYYPTLTEQMEHVAQGVVWTNYPNVRTQTSRQYGRGR